MSRRKNKYGDKKINTAADEIIAANAGFAIQTPNTTKSPPFDLQRYSIPIDLTNVQIVRLPEKRGDLMVGEVLPGKFDVEAGASNFTITTANRDKWQVDVGYQPDNGDPTNWRKFLQGLEIKDGELLYIRIMAKYGKSVVDIDIGSANAHGGVGQGSLPGELRIIGAKVKKIS